MFARLVPSSETVWEGVGGVILLEKVCQCRWTVGLQKTPTIPSVLSLPTNYGSRCELSVLPTALFLHCYHEL